MGVKVWLMFHAFKDAHCLPWAYLMEEQTWNCLYARETIFWVPDTQSLLEQMPDMQHIKHYRETIKPSLLLAPDNWEWGLGVLSVVRWWGGVTLPHGFLSCASPEVRCALKRQSLLRRLIMIRRRFGVSISLRKFVRHRGIWDVVLVHRKFIAHWRRFLRYIWEEMRLVCKSGAWKPRSLLYGSI